MIHKKKKKKTLLSIQLFGISLFTDDKRRRTVVRNVFVLVWALMARLNVNKIKRFHRIKRCLKYVR